MRSKMNCPQNTNMRFITSVKLAVIAMLASVSANAFAELKWQSADEATDTEVAYVDSVTSWGAWELDIEPAAGGITPASTGALNARNSKVALRTNSIAALAPPNSPVIPTPPTPVPPIVTPQIPTVTNINPSVPIPVGAP